MLSAEGPLTAAELAELEATLLPALERHHLRLLAHSLRTIQAISSTTAGSIPDRKTLVLWALQQEALAGDQLFAESLADQLLGTAAQLETIGERCGKTALALDLTDLIAWASAAAQSRLAIISETNPAP